MRENSLIPDENGNARTGVVIFFTILMIFLFAPGPDPFSETFSWELEAGQYDFLAVPCDYDDCDLEMSFTQTDYGNITISLVTKSEFIKFQNCEIYEVVEGIIISEKASHSFDKEQIPEGDYYLLVDFNYCSNNDSDLISKGDALVTTPSSSFWNWPPF